MAKLKDDCSANQDTQPIDSLSSSPSDFESFEDGALINDQNIETQIIDTQYDDEEFLLCGETLTVDLGFETQEEPILDEIQLLEDFDGLSTQFLDHCDDDDVTLILEDNNELSDRDDARSKAESLLSIEKNRQKNANEKIESTAAWSNKHVISGNGPRFASVRSAAFRASALAARVATQKLPNSDCCQGEVGNQQYAPSVSVEKKDDLRRGNRVARKLFLEDSPEKNCPSVGLSYIDSQEPGEESQASALNLVDKLIRESCLEFALDVETDCGRRTEEKVKFVPSIKGPLELAKKLSSKSVVIGNGAFDWDDSREDEGGGDLYCRRKEEFYGVSSKVRESSTLPRAQERELIHETHKGLGVAVDKRKAHSDSKLLKRSVTRSRKNIQADKKNLCKEFAEVSKDSNKKRFGMREVVALGNATQVAAEAIDTLCSGDLAKASCFSGKELSPGEDRGFSNCGVITRQSRGSKRVQAMGKDELLKRKLKKASPISAKACGENMERSSKGKQLDKEGPCCSKRKIQTASRKTKKNLVDELDEVSKGSNSRRFDRHEDVEAGPDTQSAAEVINALKSGNTRDMDPKPNCLIGKRLSPEGGISSIGVATRKSKRNKGIQAVDNDLDSLKPKTKKARSILAKACEKNMDRYPKNDKLGMLDEVVVSSTEKRQGELSNKNSTPKLLKQSSRGEAEVLNYPKRRRSARISQDQIIEEDGRCSDQTLDTPVKSKKAPKTVSPICMGDEYYKTSSFKSNTTREFRNLTSPVVESIPETKSTRKRRDMASIRVLFSQHLDEDVTKHQKKILARLNISEASSMMEATHFIADNFMRTRNMLEAIASGKPVVTTQWLESINQVNIYVDEDLYILRDSKKEKELGFNIGVSLARARQYPLLQGRKVFITPNTKPGLNTITTLVKAVHGLPVERLGRSALSKDKVPENLLVLSCEDDRDICIPFLERGAEVYSSELLLNGIVTQKLEYERYRLFTDHVRRTRSTIRIMDGKGKLQRRSR